MPSIFIVRRPSHSFDRQTPILLYGLTDFSVGISLRAVATRRLALLVAITITKVRGRINYIRHTGRERAVDVAPLPPLCRSAMRATIKDNMLGIT